jgi:hypothetical protein
MLKSKHGVLVVINATSVMIWMQIKSTVKTPNEQRLEYNKRGKKFRES